MSKLTGPEALRLIRVKRTALYSATGRRHGNIHYRRTSPKSPQHHGIARFLWYAINSRQKRK
ncbi:MAG: hypothetical protein OXU36_04150 [Candidatus Poribacteria bacterium]|nr:hypothetical protein [Candidatus Poribacteria bacterium]